MSSTNPFAALQSIEGICAKAILFHNIAEGTISDADSGSSCPSVSPSLSPPRKAGEAYCKAQAAGKIRDGDRVAIVVGTDASGSALEAEIKRRVTQPETVATIYMHESALREVITVVGCVLTSSGDASSPISTLRPCAIWMTTDPVKRAVLEYANFDERKLLRLLQIFTTGFHAARNQTVHNITVGEAIEAVEF
ncbi:hypothetical protein BDD12DRAFT_897839 [Trichophaea hybrida]|nr:hypothetical protein BDD12DRAFT_897839 [Trichophaea hybrida]